MLFKVFSVKTHRVSRLLTQERITHNFKNKIIDRLIKHCFIEKFI